jgi:glutaminyl-tRNA synthetase
LVVKHGLVEPALAEVEVGEIVQFERVGFFRKDEDSSHQPVFNRAVTLKDGWAKVQKKGS